MKKNSRLINRAPIEYRVDNTEQMQKVRKDLESIGQEFDRERILNLSNGLVELAT